MQRIVRSGAVVWGSLRVGWQRPLCQWFSVGGGQPCRASAAVEETYRAMVDKHGFQRDAGQERVIRALGKVADRIETFEIGREEYLQVSVESRIKERIAVLQEESGTTDGPQLALETRAKLEQEKAAVPRPRAPKGMYIWGSVGTGKSVCMDVFFNALPIEKKRRVHFHDFMSEIHERVHTWKEMREAARKQQLQNSEREVLRKENGSLRHLAQNLGKLDLSPESDALLNVATDISREATVLCFDEFQVSDIADAVIMTKLFNTMWQCGTVVVATSNRPPDDLYENGLNRRDFLPFIDSLWNRCSVLDLGVASSDSVPTDYRMLATSVSDEEALFYHPINADTEKRFANTFRTLCALESSAEVLHSVVINTKFGRSLSVPMVCGKVCQFDYSDLCRSDIGAGDFATLATHFHTICIKNIPVMSTKAHNEARRFITLIDQLYESKLRIVCLAETAPNVLFQREDEGEEKSTLGGGIEWGKSEKGAHKLVHKVNESELASVKELEYAFQRASSRLVEMNSVEYLQRFFNDDDDKGLQ